MSNEKFTYSKKVTDKQAGKEADKRQTSTEDPKFQLTVDNIKMEPAKRKKKIERMKESDY